MNTPAHLIMGAAAFGRKDAPALTIAGLVGGFLPDLSLYAMAGWEMRVKGTDPDIVFRELYYSDRWQQIFAVDNSFVLWGLALMLALVMRSGWAVALCGAALLHLAFDFPLHTHDARMHFWPITDWKFYSPFSYWDTNAGGGVIGMLEIILVLILVAVLLVRHKQLWVRLGFLALAGAQVVPFVAWRLLF